VPTFELALVFMKAACEILGVDPKRLEELTDEQFAELVEAFSEWAYWDERIQPGDKERP
jgi:hypothetical protein